MAQFVCVSCRRRGDVDDRMQWYEGSERDVPLDPDDTAFEDGAYLCGNCFAKLDPEEKPRWKPARWKDSFLR
jgi:hypothetical protein